MTHRITVNQIFCRSISIVGIAAGIILIGLGAGVGLPAVIIGGIFLFAAGSVSLLFQRMIY
jgi:hypothetical protein